MTETHDPADRHGQPAGSPSPAPASHGDAAPVRSALPSWLPRVLLFVIGGFFLLLALRHVVNRLSTFVGIIVVALFVSFALEPAVNWLVARGWRRGVASTTIMLAATLLALAFFAVMIPLFVRELASLINHVPKWVTRLNPRLHRWFHFTISSGSLSEQVHRYHGVLTKYAGAVTRNVLGLARSIGTALFEVLAVGFFSYYLIADGPRMRRGICSLLRPDRQRQILDSWEIAIEKTGGYLYSRALLALVSSIFAFIAFVVLGIPLALPVAIWVGIVSEFIPTIGSYIAAVIPLLLAVLISPTRAIILLAYIIVYQQAESILLAPRLTAHTMRLHPAVAFGSVIVGASLFGPLGAFLAIPAVATIQAALSTYVTRYAVIDDELTHVDGAAAPAPPLWQRLRRRRPHD